VTSNPDFKVTIIQHQITRKWHNIELHTYNGLPIQSLCSDLEQPLHPVSRSRHSLAQIEYLRNGTRYRHSFNEILIGTYTRPLLNSVISNDLEWPRVTWQNIQWRRSYWLLISWGWASLPFGEASTWWVTWWVASCGLSATAELLVVTRYFYSLNVIAILYVYLPRFGILSERLNIERLLQHKYGSPIILVFCRAMLCISAAIAGTRCLSVCLSRSWVAPKRIKIS